MRSPPVESNWAPYPRAPGDASPASPAASARATGSVGREDPLRARLATLADATLHVRGATFRTPTLDAPAVLHDLDVHAPSVEAAEALE